MYYVLTWHKARIQKYAELTSQNATENKNNSHAQDTNAFLA